jgi:hypothetical protein
MSDTQKRATVDGASDGLLDKRILAVKLRTSKRTVDACATRQKTA